MIEEVHRVVVLYNANGFDVMIVLYNANGFVLYNATVTLEMFVRDQYADDVTVTLEVGVQQRRPRRWDIF